MKVILTPVQSSISLSDVTLDMIVLTIVNGNLYTLANRDNNQKGFHRFLAPMNHREVLFVSNSFEQSIKLAIESESLVGAFKTMEEAFEYCQAYMSNHSQK